MRHGKPIIGISGGIGSGKTFVADLFGEMGCLVIKSDEQVLRVYEEQAVLERLRAWWGGGGVAGGRKGEPAIYCRSDLQ